MSSTAATSGVAATASASWSRKATPENVSCPRRGAARGPPAPRTLCARSTWGVPPVVTWRRGPTSAVDVRESGADACARIGGVSALCSLRVFWLSMG